MNIDNLISKYLDGDLSEAEDLKLRNIITSNDKARDIFNTYIDLHIVAKEDAKSIQTPSDLKSETEDKVLMTIMSATAAPARVSRSLNIFNLFPKQLVSMVAVLLLISFTYTSDINFFRSSLPSYDKAELLMNIPIIESRDVTSSSNNSQVNANQNVINSAPKSENIANILDNTNEESNQEVQELLVENENTFSLIESSSDDTDNIEVLANTEQKAINLNVEETDDKYNVALPTFSTQSDNTSNMQFGAINDRIRPTQNNLAINNIQITAFSSNPYTLYGFDEGANATMNSYSQAISISINTKTRVGLEVGFSDIAYRGETFTSTNILDLYGRETGQQLVIRTERDKDFALYWGQMFVQSELFKMDDFDLGMRLGFGLSSDGFNTNSKLLASYEIIDGIKLTAGTEFTYFTVSLPQVVNAYTDNYYSFAMLYGLQFNF